MERSNTQARSDVAATATGVLETWVRVASSHQVRGASCSCGADSIVLRLADFEQDIGDYLRNEGERYQRRDVLGLLEKLAVFRCCWSIAGFLETLADPAKPIASIAAQFVLDRLPRTVQSFEPLHRSR